MTRTRKSIISERIKAIQKELGDSVDTTTEIDGAGKESKSQLVKMSGKGFKGAGQAARMHHPRLRAV